MVDSRSQKLQRTKYFRFGLGLVSSPTRLVSVSSRSWKLLLSARASLKTNLYHHSKSKRNQRCTKLSIINIFKRSSDEKTWNPRKFLVKHVRTFSIRSISYFKRRDNIADSGSGYFTPTIRTCCNIRRATNAAYALTLADEHAMKAPTNRSTLRDTKHRWIISARWWDDREW